MKVTSLDKLISIAGNPFSFLEQWRKSTGKKVIATTIADIPEELIYAADLLPFTIQGTSDPISVAGGRLPDNCCSLARSNLELVMGFAGSFFNGYVLPQVCDTTQHLSDIWRLNVPHEFFENFLVPRQIDRPSARNFYLAECKRLKEDLQEYVGHNISDEKIWNSIRVYNENRRLLRQLYEIKRIKPVSLSNLALFSAIKSAFFMDRKEHSKMLLETLHELSAKGDNLEPEHVLLALSGIVIEPFKVLSILDEVMTTVVWDDLVIGSRYIYADVPESMDGDPLVSLTERHFLRGPYSPIHEFPVRTLNNLIEGVQKYKANGLLYMHIKFCESQSYDYPNLLKQLKAEKIPTLLLETDFQSSGLLRLKTRIEAFLEKLRYGSFIRSE